MANNKAHALARDELIRVLTAYKGVTTSAGESDGTTLIDSNLRDSPSISASAIPEKTILITSGGAIQEDKGAASFDTITSISIQTNDTTPQVFISAADGAKVNLTAEAQLGYTGVVMMM